MINTIIKRNVQRYSLETEIQLRNLIVTYASVIAHDQRSPLAIIGMKTHFLQKFCDKLDNYSKEATLTNEDILEFKNTIEALNKCTNLMKNTININLNNIDVAIKIHTGQQVENTDFIECSIKENLMHDKLLLYFKEDEKDLLKVNSLHNFNYIGNSISVDQILANLLTNALYQIRKNGRGKIFVTTEDGGNVNILRVKDTAGGASPGIVAHMFDSFFTTKSDGNGIGLDFCKKTMQLLGGDIVAKSMEGDYMEFILTFPKDLVKN